MIRYNLRAVIILRVVDEDPSFSLNVAGLEVVHHPKAVVEETLIVVVEIVVQCLTVVDSSVCVTCLSLRVCPHIRKPDIMCVCFRSDNLSGLDVSSCKTSTVRLN